MSPQTMIEVDGRRYRVEIQRDDSDRRPWEDDGHGPVSDWTSRAKRAGEWLLVSDRHGARYYDHAEATRIAKRDGWGLSEPELAILTVSLGREPTRGEIIAAAVLADFRRLLAWCTDDWHYCGVVVTERRTDPDGIEYDGPSDSLWGIESDCTDYITETARELAEGLAAQPTKRSTAS